MIHLSESGHDVSLFENLLLRVRAFFSMAQAANDGA
jgi:hypothetical protein